MRKWPKLICPKCGSEACAEMATKYAGDAVRVRCAICQHYDLRPKFSGVSENEFVRLVRLNSVAA